MTLVLTKGSTPGINKYSPIFSFNASWGLYQSVVLTRNWVGCVQKSLAELESQAEELPVAH